MWVDQFTRLLLKHRLLFLLLIILIIAVFVFFASKLKFDNTPDSFFISTDKTLEFYKKFQKNYASDEYSLFVIRSPDKWTLSYIESIRELVSKLSRVDNVIKVRAITNVRYIEGSESGIEVGDFIPEGLTLKQILEKKKIAVKHPYYKNTYISADGKYLGIVAETNIIEGEVDYKIAIRNGFEKILAEKPYSDLDISVVGAPVLDAEVREIVAKESGLFGAIVFLLVAIGYWFMFRSLIGVVLPLIIAVVSILSAFGIMGLFGFSAGLLTPIIPSFMISVGAGSAVYLLTELHFSAKQGTSLKESIFETMRSTAVPCSLSVVTTAGALLAFSSSKIKPVEEVGLTMGLALLVSLVVSLILVPIVFSLIRDKKIIKLKSNDLFSYRTKLLSSISVFVANKYKSILVFFMILIIVSASGFLKLDTDYYYLGTFNADTRIRLNYDKVDNTIGGSSSIEIIIDTSTNDGVKNPFFLEEVDRLINLVKSHKELSPKVYSLVSVIKELNQAVNNNDINFYRLPESINVISQLLLLFESSGSDELEHLTTANYSQIRINVKVKNLPDKSYVSLFSDINKFGESSPLFMKTDSQNSEVEVTETENKIGITGLVHMWSKISSYLFENQIQSVGYAMLIVLFVMIWVFKSIKLGVFMAMSNAVAVLVVLGFMGWFGIYLDPYTVLVAAIALGILDDDTIHFVKRVQYEYDKVDDICEALHRTYITTGQAVVASSVVLIMAFSVYSLSQVSSLNKFGLLISLAIFMGLIVELFLTPAILMYFYKKKQVTETVMA
ncbi:hypothetical protein MNBD_GAMMA22-51 [hydrothermal vent metagenome]|uniref:SSD domain-containing protein n=1 Tax=hydrothermal vent metagenome TaxID=652676 RepID=A0A3B0ZP82_9ZZZZ